MLRPGQSAANAAEIANCIAGELHSLIVLDDGQELFVSCSMGIAEYPRNGRDMDVMINSARSAMAAIKEHGAMITGISFRESTGMLMMDWLWKHH